MTAGRPEDGIVDPARALSRLFSRTIATGGAIVLLLLAGLAGYSYDRAYAKVLDRHRQATIARQSGLEQLVVGMRDHVGILRASLRDKLADPGAEASQAALAFPLDPATSRPLIVTQPGGLDLPQKRADIAAVASLLPLHRAAREVMPAIRWSYVFDADKSFIATVPWVPVSAGPLSAAARLAEYRGYFDYDIFLDGTPARNPDRLSYWTPAYLDAGGEGLMVSHGAPVDVSGRFRAIVGADILLSYLSDYLASFAAISGRFALVDQAGATIAASGGVADPVARIVPAAQALGAEPPAKTGSFVTEGGQEMLGLDIAGAPWRLVHAVPRAAVRGEATREVAAYFILAAGVLAGMAALYAVVSRQFVQPAGRLASYAQRLAVEPEIPAPPPVPTIWRPWFAQLEASVRERRRLAAATRDAKALKAAVVDAALDALIITDEAGRVIEFNGSAERIFGISAAEAAGRPIGALIVPPEMREAHERGMARFVATRQPKLLARRIEVEAMRADGARFPVELVINHVLSDGRDVFAASLRDLSEARAAAAEIRRQSEALHQSEKLAALGSLLAGVAHELNNPLSIVVGHALMLGEEAEARAPDLVERTEIIQAAADRCARIVRSFLGMVRQRAPQHRAVPVRALVEEPLELLAYGLRTRVIEVVQDIPAGLPDISGDIDQLTQVMMNLILNAQQALESAPAPRRLTIRARAAEAGVEILVCDSGPGVPEAVRARIFEPFFTTKPAGTGTGIGLAVSRGIVERHGGRLDFVEAGQGACFAIRLPVGLAQEISSPDREPVGEKPCPWPRHALVVDDEAPIASLLAEIVGAAGYRCAVAANGAAAQALVETRTFDAILCDLHMPDMDGGMFYDWLARTRPELCARVAFVTGDTLGPELSHAGRPVIQKPFLPAEIRRTLALIAEEARTGRSTGEGGKN